MSETRKLDSLRIYVGDKLVGTLTKKGEGVSFAYSPDWIKANGKALSASLPTDGNFTDNAANNYFRNLLPEGNRPEIIASMTRVRFSELVEWLSTYGEDLPGNISVKAANKEKDSPEDITERIERLVAGNMPLDSMRMHLSLSGIESKTAVIAKDFGTKWHFYTPTTDNPSTHILKQASQICILEAISMELAKRCQINVSWTKLIPISGKPILIVKRFDRFSMGEGAIGKIAQEDFCQILGRKKDDKYWISETEGIGNKEFISLLNKLSQKDRMMFMRSACFSIIIGNNDDHAKNYSILHTPNGDRLAPAYDLISASAAKKYVESCREISDRLSRPFGGVLYPKDITPQAILAYADEFSISREDYVTLWQEVCALAKQEYQNASKKIVYDCENQKFSQDSMQEIKNYAMLMDRHLKQRIERFERLGNSTAKLIEAEPIVEEDEGISPEH